MTRAQDDDLDMAALTAAARAATPRPDPALRAAHLRLAAENFARAQETAQAARLTFTSPTSGLWQGARDMLSTLTTRGGLTVTTALVAVGLLVLTPYGQNLIRGGQPLLTEGEVPRVEQPVNPSDVPPDATIAQSGEVALQTAPADTAPATEPTAATGTDTVVPPPPAPEATLGAAPGATIAAVPEATLRAAPEATLRAAREATLRADPVAASEADPAAASEAAPAADPVAAPAAAVADQALDDGLVMEAQGGVAATAVEPGSLVPAPAVIGRQGIDMAAGLPEADTEAFANAVENPVKAVTEAPVSTFSIDVDTASYAIIRQSLNAGQLPPPDAVRVEEMVNYFPYDYPAPAAGDGPFRPTITVMDTPWNSGTELVHIALQGRMPAIEDRPPLNLVFLIDTSGSMEDPTKLPLLKQSFRLMLDNLRPEDQVAIVAYAGSSGLVLPPTAAADRQAILAAMSNLSAGGGTNGQGGLEQAYAVAAQMADEGEVARVILATDGDFNVGPSSIGEMTSYIADQRETGVYLSVLGFGRGNLDDATMQALAQNGNGTAAYIDTLNEAQKVLVDQLTGALFAIAADVKVQVEFNPAVIAEYRLIGYETRALAREDFNNDAVDAGEIGAGLSVTAIYEVTPVGSDAMMTTPLRYGDAAATGPVGNEIGFLRLRWKEPGASDSQLLETPILLDAAAASDTQLTEARFAVAVAGMGQLLRDSPYLGGWDWDQAIALAAENRGTDAFGYRNEAVRLMRLAQSLQAN